MTGNRLPAAKAPARLGLGAYGSGLQMVSMRLPPDAPRDLSERLYAEHRIEIPTWKTGTIRASFQGYNDERDLDALAEALPALLAPTRAGG